ncbi:MAG: MG2 domain-containing protein [Bacteroidota bacterium]
MSTPSRTQTIWVLLLSFIHIQLSGQALFSESMQRYQINYLPEKVYVHTDKTIYAGGETVWLAVYLMDGFSHRPGTLSDVVRVELHASDGKIVAKQNLYAPDGFAASELLLPYNLASGSYQLTAYTNYQRNSGEEMLYRKDLRVLPGLGENTPSKPEFLPTSYDYTADQKATTQLRFFPEGGDCIAGAPCRMAYVVENDNGTPSMINAEVVDSLGAVVSTIEAGADGMGSFVFIPQPAQQYQARLSDGRSFVLPGALEKGYRLSVQKRTKEVRITVQTNLSEGLQGTHLGVHLRGEIYLDRSILTENRKAYVDLPLEDLVPGVFVCTLFDPNGQPVAERLFFHAPEKKENELLLTTHLRQYDARDSVNLSMKVAMEGVHSDSLSKARMSLSVLPLPSTSGPQGDDICTWLLLNSDLDRPVPYSPGLLSATDAKTRDRKVDEFLMTRGWRRFRWEIALDEPKKFQPEYPLEQGLFLQGRMGKYNNPKSPQPGSVILSHLESGFFEETETDEKGHFSFGPFVEFDTLDVVLKGYYSRNKDKKLKKGKQPKNRHYTHLELFDHQSPTLPPPAPVTIEKKTKESEAGYSQLSQDYLSIARNYDSLSVLLDVVDVKAKRISPAAQERYERSIMYGGRPDTRIIVDSLPGGNIPQTIFDMLRGVPGVRITGGLGNEQVLVRGAGVPAFFFDGMPMDLETLRYVDIHNIEFVDVIRGVRAGIMGNAAANGAVLVYSRTGSSLTQNPFESPGVTQAQIHGFYKAREFAVFDPLAPGNQNRPDFRTTLHWNAEIEIGEEGTAKEVFTTSDQKGRFVVIGQGLRSDGKPFFGTTEFVVK